MEQEPKQSNDIDQNISADWEGIDDIEQELQTKIKNNMEQEPKIEKDLKKEQTTEGLNVVWKKLVKAVESKSGPNQLKETLAVLEDAIQKLEDIEG